MRNYRFETTTTMKEYNRKKWWIDSDIIRPITIKAETLKEAIQKYREHANKMCVEISDNAIRTKSPMYVDTKEGITKQIGYVITGKTDFQDNNYNWSSQYIDLWVTIKEISDIDFEEEENNYD